MHRRREMHLQAQEKASRGYIGVAKCIFKPEKKRVEDTLALRNVSAKGPRSREKMQRLAAACSLLYREERRIAELLKISSEEVRKMLKKAGESI